MPAIQPVFAVPRVISHEEIMALDVPLDEVFNVVERAFVEHGRGAVEMPPKIGIHTKPGTFIHAMPACIPALKLCGMKWVSGYPQNADAGLPTIAGMLVLNDVETGMALAILDARWITAIRTAVVSALMVRTCGRRDASSLSIAGCDVQGQNHLRCLLHTLPNIKSIRLYDVNVESARRLSKIASGWTAAAIEVCLTPDDCLRGAEVMATCTSGKTLEVEDRWLPKGGTAVGVDSHVAWVKLFQSLDKLIMDDELQAREFEKHGKYRGPLPAIHAELGQLLIGAKPGRERNDERIVGLPLGLAIADLAVGQLVWRKCIPASSLSV